jgi:hypothetical protein
MNRKTLRRILPIAAALVLVAAMSARCGEGPKAETVVVPSGDPTGTGDDPYDDGGDFNCGEVATKDGAVSLNPVDLGEDGERVLVTLLGDRGLYFFLLDEGEVGPAAAELASVLPRHAVTVVDREQVDDLRAEYCDDDAPGGLGRDLRAALARALGEERLNALGEGLCD